MKNFFCKLLALSLCVATFASCSSAAAKPNGKSIAESGENKIPLETYMYYYNSTKGDAENQMIQSGSFTAETIKTYWTEVQGDTTMEAKLKDVALKSAEQSYTLYDIATKAGFKLNDQEKKQAEDEVDAVLTKISTDKKQAETDFSKTYGLSTKDMKALSVKLKVVNNYVNSIYEGVKVTDEQIQDYYNQNAANYDQVTVAHVLFLTDSTKTAEEQKAAEQKANDTLARVNAGEDIGALAKELSEDPGSKDKNGEYTFPRGQMVKEFEDWAFAAKEGDTGIVKTSYGYHVMKFIGHAKFEDFKSDIQNTLVNEEGSKLITAAIDATGYNWTLNQEVYDSIKIQ